MNIELIEEYIKREKISKSGFCKRCGISYHALKNIYSFNGKVRIRTLLKVIKVLGVSANKFLGY